MISVLTFLFWLAVCLVAYTYVVFPLLMFMTGSKPPVFPALEPGELPTVGILMAVYNEEEIIEEKLKTTFDTTYPPEKLEFWIGSDRSSDRTDEIIREYATRHPNLHLIRFEERTGKPQIVNHLATLCKAGIFVLTDADTMLRPNTLEQMVRPYRDPRVGGVQPRMISLGTGEDVSEQEVRYNDFDQRIKQGESRWGAVIGAQGPCYSIRSNLYEPVPKGFIVDDFYIFMHVLRKGFRTVFASDAVCLTHILGESEVQFRRKARISWGNYQNFFYFKDFLNPLRNFASLAYWSHKGLRWFTPHLMVLALLLNVALAFFSDGYATLLALHLGGYALGLLELLLSQAGLHIKVLRLLKHFVWMNAAMLVGFVKYLRLEGTGIWNNTGK